MDEFDLFRLIKSVFTFLFLLTFLLIIYQFASDSEFRESVEQQVEQPYKFELLLDTSNFDLYCDPVTDVIYVWRKVGYSSGLSVYYNPETGLPMTLSEYSDFFNDAHIAQQ